MLCFDGGVACEVGVKGAVVLQQIHYWTSKGFGRKINGRVFVYNTYEEWQKQFPFMSISTLKRTFKKLVECELVFTYRKGYDRTSHWSLNYSHPIVSKWHYGRGQNDTMDNVNLTRSIGTYINQKEQQRLTSGKFPRSKQTTTKPAFTTSSYREEYKDANEWLESQAKDFQSQTTSYLEYHCNTPKVKYPHALRMKIIVEIWKKYNDRTSQTDFSYTNKEELKPSKRIDMKLNQRKSFDGGLDSEMESLYLQGELE